MTPAELLRELHRLHSHARELQTEIDAAPAQRKGQKNRVTRAEENLREAQDTLKKLKVAVHEKEGALKAVFQQMAKYEKQRNEAQATKEYAALQREIDHAKEQSAKLEEDILNGMGEIDERTARIPELERMLAQVKADVAKYESEAEERESRLKNELENTRTQLSELEQQIPNDMRPIYQRLIQSYGADAIAAVRDKTCTSCYSTITLQQLRELEGGRFVQCKSCSKALYVQA